MRRSTYFVATVSAAFVLGAVAYVTPATAQQAAPAPPTSELSDRCPGLVAADRPRVIPAAFQLAARADGEVRLTYVGHSTFLIESPRRVRIATDYND